MPLMWTYEYSCHGPIPNCSYKFNKKGTPRSLKTKSIYDWKNCQNSGASALDTWRFAEDKKAWRENVRLNDD
jgi:hypothetical protein